MSSATPGVEIVRNVAVMNHHSPEGRCEIVFRNVRVPVSNLLGEEGGGFALPQARLGVAADADLTRGGADD